MLERPDLSEADLIACLGREFGLAAAQAAFLPLGADLNTAVYRVTAVDGRPYFLKLRRGAFDETSVLLPVFLLENGVEPILAPLPARSARPWARLGEYAAILYPFIEGRDGYETELSASQWAVFGAALRRIHSLRLPAGLAARIRRETFSPRYRQAVEDILGRLAERERFGDALAARLAEVLRANRAVVIDLVRRAEKYAALLQARPLPCVLCHSDLHAGNLLIEPGRGFYIVDWDEPIFAPRERDLMFIGGGQGFIAGGAAAEEALFYAGYGPADADPYALAYYRSERILTDLALYYDQICLSPGGKEDRAQALRYVEANFLPGGTVETAYRTGDPPRG